MSIQTDNTPREPEEWREARFESILSGRLPGAEVVIALVGAVGADLQAVANYIAGAMQDFRYEVRQIRVSALIRDNTPIDEEELQSEPVRTNALMAAGDRIRSDTGNNAMLALAAVAEIYTNRDVRDDEGRNVLPSPCTAYIINSLKHPEEVIALRRIYGNGFFLFGIYAEEDARRNSLVDKKGMTRADAEKLIRRDEAEGLRHGQRTRDTFHLSDFFIRLDTEDRTKASLKRVLDLLFAHPFRTPLFDEYAMFMAFASATRSADLSRQIGSVIARDSEVLASGANECPRFGGGTYWPQRTRECTVVDEPDGRDYRRGHDSNDMEKAQIVQDAAEAVRKTWEAQGKTLTEEEKKLVLDALTSSPLDEVTEYGRVVHAEMDALLACARNNINCRGATLYCTTFPCHNCAKHIIAAGIERVVYIEPYPKSRALKFHHESAYDGFISDPARGDRVAFEPFVGVGPRRFFDLFSMRHGSGFPLRRKDEDGRVLPWSEDGGTMRIPMLPWNYLQREEFAVERFSDDKELLKGWGDGDEGEGGGQGDQG